MARVLCLIDTLSSGGAERQMSYLSIGLKKRGHDVTLMVFYPDHRFYDEEITKAGVRILYNDKGKNPIRRVREIISAVGKYKPDAVIAYKDGVTMSACLARYMKRFRLIVSERNTTQELTRYERLKFFLYRYADIIVPNSFSQGKFIEKHYPQFSSKTHVVTNMLDLTKFLPADTHRDGAPVNIITVARVMAQKNVLNYIKALRILKDKGYVFECNWYGYFEPNYTSNVNALIQELGVGDCIRFHNPEKDVTRVYQSGDLFCLPSIYEGFPNALCEAMACGLPVACSNVCDNPNIVEDKMNGVVFDPYKPAKIASRLSELLDMGQNELQEMGHGNRKRMEEMCAEDAFLDSYERLING